MVYPNTNFIMDILQMIKSINLDDFVSLELMFPPSILCIIDKKGRTVFTRDCPLGFQLPSYCSYVNNLLNLNKIKSDLNCIHRRRKWTISINGELQLSIVSHYI